MNSVVMLAALLSLLLPFSAGAASGDKERKKIRNMSQEVLARLYDEKPSTRAEIRKSEGYAVFSNVGVNLVLFSAGGGRGVVHNNRTGEDTFMNMASAGVGIGLGVKDFRGVFVFHNRDALKQFIDHGWDFSGQADAAAKSSDKGGAESLSATVRREG